MARDDDDKSLPADSICGSLARVFRGIAGVTPPSGEDPLADSFEAAYKYAERVFAAANDSGDVSISASRLAASMAREFCRAYGTEPAQLEDLPPRVRVAWLASARHVANLLLAESSSDIADCERKIFEWAAARL